MANINNLTFSKLQVGQVSASASEYWFSKTETVLNYNKINVNIFVVSKIKLGNSFLEGQLLIEE